MNRNDFMNYQWSFVPVTSTTSKNVDCSTVMFINQGTQNVEINGVLLLTPGQGFTFEGYPGEMNTQAYDIIFPNDRLPGCKLVIVMKEYKGRGA